MVMQTVLGLVSAIITTHDRCGLVRRAIASAEAQDYPLIEIIVVDDASTDGTREELTALSRAAGDEGTGAGGMPRLTYIYIDPEDSRGANHARNVGILASRGEYIAFLDDDDEWMPEKIRLEVSYLTEHPECMLVHCGYITETDFERRTPCDIDGLAEGDISREALMRIVTTTSRLMVRRELIDRIGLFDEGLKYWQEREFMIRAGEVSPLGLVPERAVLYRVLTQDSGRLSNRLAGWEDSVRYIMTKHAARYEELGPTERRRHEITIARDGADRARAAGDKRASAKYLRRYYEADPGAKHYIKYLLNRVLLYTGIKYRGGFL